MFNHMVVARFKAGTTQDQIDAITAGLASLPGAIEAIDEYRFGQDAGITDGTWDYGILARFATESDYAAYASHPAHVEVIQTRITPVVDEIARVQFES
jgi:hypothetical protein